MGLCAMKCCDMTAGQLREPVEFQRNTRASDGAGGFTVTWPTIAGTPTRARARFTSGSERYASERVEARVSVKIVVRYFSGLLEADRVEIRGKPYNIRFIDNIEFADKWLEISLDGGVAT